MITECYLLAYVYYQDKDDAASRASASSGARVGQKSPHTDPGSPSLVSLSCIYVF